ncbi:Transmembrane domain-containing protein [Orpheovirus IHUMI-LCC2]|uniref:Transmembrane domain-containing protein n=1 Tax=Orpheovirus IHUMI-LCC2 TaxID=2023057 RepID=A0A2I2L5F0_9VIRU|nr:Transmembrane domain-containing protein [Orpheovirus IHUMI-LCC2]SNW62741.1 Transmembrane domain-containing protein [Orpheovirus IHUMI-LCC2]
MEKLITQDHIYDVTRICATELDMRPFCESSELRTLLVNRFFGPYPFLYSLPLKQLTYLCLLVYPIKSSIKYYGLPSMLSVSFEIKSPNDIIASLSDVNDQEKRLAVAYNREDYLQYRYEKSISDIIKSDNKAINITNTDLVYYLENGGNKSLTNISLSDINNILVSRYPYSLFNKYKDEILINKYIKMGYNEIKRDNVFTKLKELRLITDYYSLFFGLMARNIEDIDKEVVWTVYERAIDYSVSYDILHSLLLKSLKVDVIDYIANKLYNRDRRLMIDKWIVSGNVSSAVLFLSLRILYSVHDRYINEDMSNSDIDNYKSALVKWIRAEYEGEELLRKRFTCLCAVPELGIEFLTIPLDIHISRVIRT